MRVSYILCFGDFSIVPNALREGGGCFVLFCSFISFYSMSFEDKLVVPSAEMPGWLTWWRHLM